MLTSKEVNNILKQVNEKFLEQDKRLEELEKLVKDMNTTKTTASRRPKATQENKSNES